MGTNETVVLSQIRPRERVNVLRPYQVHRTVMSAFDDGRVLFRIEDDVVIVQSLGEPDWRKAGSRILSFSVARQRLEFNSGQTLTFRLLANPTIKRDGRRHGLHSDAEQLAWMERKALDSGFEILQLATRKIGMAVGSTKGGHKLALLAVRFNGLLRVLEPDKLCASIRDGIGSGKGLGFGLFSVMSIQPAPPII